MNMGRNLYRAFLKQGTALENLLCLMNAVTPPVLLQIVTVLLSVCVKKTSCNCFKDNFEIHFCFTKTLARRLHFKSRI